MKCTVFITLIKFIKLLFLLSTININVVYYPTLMYKSEYNY